MTKGRLLQPFTKVMWGSQDLTPYEHDGISEIMAQNLSFALEEGEHAPQCTFDMVASAAGMELFSRLKKEAIDEIIAVEIGYPNGSSFKQQFKYSGLSYTTGMNPKLEITATSALKGPWTDNKISFTMSEEITLAEYPKFLQEKAGEGAASLKFQFTPEAEKYASGTMIKTNVIDTTPHQALTDMMREHGLDVKVSDSSFDNTVIIDYPPNKDGTLEQENVKLADGKSTPEPAKRSVYIIGPGIMTNLKRTQSFTLGQTETDRAQSTTATKSTETEAKEVVSNAPAQQAAAASSNKAGTTGPSDKPKSRSGTVKKADDKTADEARAKQTSLGESKIDFSIPMLPYIVGIKPRDIVVIPSLSGPGSYLEDWVVTSANYSQSTTGNYDISISGNREYTGEGTMLDAGTEAQVIAKCVQLTTPAKWSKMYWVQGPDNDMPLAN